MAAANTSAPQGDAMGANAAASQPGAAASRNTDVRASFIHRQGSGRSIRALVASAGGNSTGAGATPTHRTRRAGDVYTPTTDASQSHVQSVSRVSPGSAGTSKRMSVQFFGSPTSRQTIPSTQYVLGLTGWRCVWGVFCVCGSTAPCYCRTLWCHSV